MYCLIPESLKEGMSLLVYKRRLRSDKLEFNNEAWKQTYTVCIACMYNNRNKAT